MAGSGWPEDGRTTQRILEALVRRLVEQRLLSPADVEALLEEAARGIDIVGDELTPQAAHAIVRDELLPAFLPRQP